MSVNAAFQHGINATVAALAFSLSNNINVVPSLPQSATNGASQLGLPNAPKLPFAVNGNPYQPPWGGIDTQNHNPYSTPPHTGHTQYYDFTIHRGKIAPDGVERDSLLINGQFPGPTIQADYGDTIQVTVRNHIDNPDEGVALHWHGLLQTGTPWEDGVPAVGQCPIAPGKSYTYSFKADLYGTSWYHSHYSAQYAGGIIGPMIVHGPSHVQYDEDLGPVLLTDYYHKDYFSIVEDVMGTDLSKIAPASDNNLINGKMNFNCSLVAKGTKCSPHAGLSKFQFHSGRTYRLRLINAGAEGIQKFSIDGHKLKVMANDFVPIKPYETEIVTLGIGQRTDVVVKAIGKPKDSYWMRSTISNCSITTQPDALAVVYYERSSENKKPKTTAWEDNTNQCANDALTTTTPQYKLTPPTNPATTIKLTISATVNKTGNFLWTVNDSSFRADYNLPILLLAKSGNDSYPYDPEWNVYDTGSNKSVRVIVENQTPVAHPMHLHGHNMYILDEGTGTWDGSTIVNARNPQRRDVQLMQPSGYLVMQFDADNPGVWPFHCHIAWHVSGGLYINLLERPDDIKKLPIPRDNARTCHEWADYTGREVVDQIDSGL